MSNVKNFAFAGAAVVAMLAAGATIAAPAADAGARQMRPVCEFNLEAVQSNVRASLSGIAAGLKLDAKQKSAFETYAKVRADFAAGDAEWRNKAYDTFSGVKSRQDAMQIRSEHRLERAAQFKKLTEARGAFVATLSPEQVQKFDAMEPGRYGKFAGPRAHRGHGPVMGMARGGDCGYGMGPRHGRDGWHHSRMPARGYGAANL